MRVTACVVSFNTAEHLPGCLDTLAAQTHGDLEVVVVDNASADGSADVVRRTHPQVRLLANPDNRGFAGGANQGLALADEGAFFVLNPDIRLAPDHLARAVAALTAGDDIASVQGRLRQMDPATGAAILRDGHPLIDTTGHTAHTNRVFRNRGGGQPDDGRFDDPADIFGVSGCAALYRLDALHDIAIDGEVFDEDMFAFFEDVDVDWRLKARGWRARYAPDAVGLHERGGEGARRSALVERLSYRNWFLTVLKNDDLRTALPHAHLLAATTTLRTVDVAVNLPAVFGRSLLDMRLIPRTLRKRRAIDASRTVDNRVIVEQWFGDFDYREWITRRLGRGLRRRA